MTHMRLRHVARVNPSSPAFDVLSDGAEVSFLRMESVWPGKWRETSEVKSKSDVVMGFTRFQDGDILVPKITPTFEASRSILVDGLSSGAGAGTTELHVIRPGQKVDPRFLLHVMHAHRFLRLGEAEMYGVAGQKRVPDQFLRDLEVWIPSLDEQRRIADFLDAEAGRISCAVTVRRRQLDLLNERVYSVLDAEIDSLCRKFGEVPFRRFVTNFEQGVSPQCYNVPSREGEWGVLKVSSVKAGVFHPSENKKLPDDIPAEVRHEVRQGDLLVTRANTPLLVGSAVAVPATRGKLLMSDKIFRISLVQEVAAEYIAKVANGNRIRGLCAASAHGTSQSMVNLKTEEIKKWPVPAAPGSEQVSFVRKSDREMASANTLRSMVTRQVALLEERKRALITAAVTGQIDVTTARGVDMP